MNLTPTRINMTIQELCNDWHWNSPPVTTRCPFCQKNAKEHEIENEVAKVAKAVVGASLGFPMKGKT